MTATPHKPTPKRGESGLLWLLAVLVALVLAASVGVAVYFYMDWRHGLSVDAIVQQRVDEQAAAQQAAPQGPPPASVRVAQVAQEKTQQRVMVVGRLQEVRRAVIASEVEGRVMELLTPAGRDVVGGETIIARVDPVWSKLAVQQAEADLAAAQAQADRSKSEYETVLALKQRGSAEHQAVVDAKAQSDTDAATVLARQAALNRAEEASKRVEIVAPFDGTVTAKLTEQGQWLDPGTSVVEIVSRGLIDAVIDVPEQFITQVPKGTDIEVRIEALDTTINGKVVAINPDGSNAARTFPVKVRIDDRGGLFKVGMSVTARVPVRARQDYLVVPRDAVQYSDNGPQVWMALVMPGSAPGSMPQAMPMDVDVLFGVDGVFAIRPLPKTPNARLMPGMDVVTEGAEQLWPTRSLMVVPGGGGDGGGEGGEVVEGGEAASLR